MGGSNETKLLQEKKVTFSKMFAENMKQQWTQEIFNT